MFRKENGVTLVALIITIIVLLILAGVTIAMVIGQDGLVSRATGANTAQSKANVQDQVALAYATVRTEDIARRANVSSSSAKNVSNYAQAIAVELVKSGAFDAVYVEGDTVTVKVTGSDGAEYFPITTGTQTTPEVKAMTTTAPTGAAITSTATY